MLAILALAATLATAAPEAAPDAPKPQPAAKAKAPKPDQVCTSKLVGKIAGHDVTHLKCEDAKPAAEPAPAAPSTPG